MRGPPSKCTAADVLIRSRDRDVLIDRRLSEHAASEARSEAGWSATVLRTHVNALPKFVDAVAGDPVLFRHDERS